MVAVPFRDFDGVLIARHEPNIIDTTNVASLPQFADRRKTKLVDGTDFELGTDVIGIGGLGIIQTVISYQLSVIKSPSWI